MKIKFKKPLWMAMFLSFGICTSLQAMKNSESDEGKQSSQGFCSCCTDANVVEASTNDAQAHVVYTETENKDVKTLILKSSTVLEIPGLGIEALNIFADALLKIQQWQPMEPEEHWKFQRRYCPQMTTMISGTIWLSDNKRDNLDSTLTGANTIELAHSFFWRQGKDCFRIPPVTQIRINLGKVTLLEDATQRMENCVRQEYENLVDQFQKTADTFNTTYCAGMPWPQLYIDYLDASGTVHPLLKAEVDAYRRIWITTDSKLIHESHPAYDMCKIADPNTE